MLNYSTTTSFLDISSQPEWHIEQELVPYDTAVQAMEAHVVDMQAGKAGEKIWLLEHPPLYTAGTSANHEDLLKPQFPVYKAGRGGQYTYHGPGQRIAYVMLDLNRRGRDIRAFVCQLESWMIAVLKEFGIEGQRRKGRIGIWVETGGTEAKIAAIGVRVRKWCTFHGVSLNVNPDLSHFAGIVPCGIKEYGVTSLKELGVNATMEEVDEVLKRQWPK